MIRDEIRSIVGRFRYRLLRKKIKVLNTDGVACLANTVSHNFTVFDDIDVDFRMRRMKWLIFGVLANELVSPASRFLMIGPRTENEILFLKSLGYTNVMGLDLISYSPWVALGDMHDMPFADNSFDVVVCGWVISYSKDPDRLAREIARVTRPGGVFALGFQRVTDSTPFIRTDEKMVHPEEKRKYRLVNSADDLKRLFSNVCEFEPLLTYNALLSDQPAEDTLAKTGFHSSQVLFVATITKKSI